jgi:hypothetical protein
MATLCKSPASLHDCRTGFVEQFPLLPSNLSALEALVLEWRQLAARKGASEEGMIKEVAETISLVGAGSLECLGRVWIGQTAA